ncbi:MAG: hypothetical protein WAW02_10875 [Sideroxyarcus sp.]
MKPIFHAFAGAAAILTIASFWTSTLVSEVFMDQTAVAAVKQWVVYGLLLLVPFMAATGGSGFALSKARSGSLLASKKRRMAVIGANGLLLMVPAAIFLNSKAAAGEFDAIFYAVQIIELVVGAIQLTLMSMNFRDGLRLAGKLAA